MKKRTFFQRILAWVLTLIMVIGAVTVPGVNTLKANASAVDETVGESVPQSNVGDDTGTSPDTSGAESYTVEILPGSNTTYFPEEPVTLTAQIKNSSGNIIPLDGINVTWSIAAGADHAVLSASTGPSTNLTVNKNVSGNTEISIKVECLNGDASIKCDTQQKITTSVRDTVTVSGKVYDSYAPGDAQTALAGAEITFEQTVAQINRQVKKTTGNDGSYTVTLYKDISYTVRITKSDYKEFSQADLSFQADTSNYDLNMDISGSVVISGESEILVDQTTQLTAAVTGSLGDVAWEITSANKGDAVITPVAGNGGVKADFFASKAGTYELQASAHGVVSDKFSITVKKKTPTLDVSINPEKDGNWYSGVAINATLKDGDKKLANQTIDVYIDDAKVGSVTTDDKGAATYTWKENKGVVKNEYSIRVKYDGNSDYYSEASWGSDKYSLSKLGQSFEFDGSNTVEKLTYGDVYYIKLKDILPDSTVSESDREKYKASESFSFEVNEAGKDFINVGAFDPEKGGYPVSVIKGGAADVKITVIQEANEFYNESRKELTISAVNKKEVGLTNIKAEDKTYDAKLDNIIVTAELDTADILKVDENTAAGVKKLSINTGEVINADAGKQAVAAKFEIPKVLADKYTLKNNGVIPDNTVFVDIKQAPLSLALGDASIEFTRIADVLNPPYDKIINVTVSGFFGGDTSENLKDFQLPNVYIDQSVIKTIGLRVGENYPMALKAETGSGNPTNNYYFDFVNQSAGKLTLLAEQVSEYGDYVSYTGGTNTSKGDDLIYYGVGQSVAKFAIQQDKRENYSKIMLSQDGQKAVDITESGVILNPELSEITYTIYLSNEDESKKTSEFSLPDFKQDATKPDVSIKISENEKGFDKFLKTLTFGLYSNKRLKAYITVSDPVVDKLSSGVSSWSYYVAEVKTDVEFTPQSTNGTLTEQEFRTQFPNASFEVSKDSNLEKTIDIGNEEESNNYIVFVIATDKVGNSCLYGSNGMIIEHIIPSNILIDYADGSSYYLDGQKEYFQGNVNLKTTVIENTEGVFSGIASVKYKVKMDGEVVKIEGSDENDDKEIYCQEAPDTTLQDLKEKYSTVVIPKSSEDSQVTINQATGSKEVEVIFTATDFAGNELVKTKEFVIDPVAPEIKNVLSSENKVQNGKYYNSDVTLNTEIKERFLNIDEGIVYKINGEVVTLQALRNAVAADAKNNIYGVSEVSVNPGPEESARDDTSVTTIKLTFSAENNYHISVSVKDKSRNHAEQELDDFVIDKTAPEASITYYSNGSGNTFGAGTNAESITYLGENYSSFTVLITVEELNFASGESVNAKFSIGATDSSGKELTEDQNTEIAKIIDGYINNAKLVKSWTPPGKDSIQYTYMVEIDKDANYTFDFDYTDLAGNKLKEAVIEKGYVTLDTKRPTGTVTVNNLENLEAKKNSWADYFLDAITFGYFGKKNVNVKMDSADVTAGVKSTHYYTTSQLMNRSQLEALSEDNWREYTKDSQVQYDANQNIIVYERVEDNAGNVEYYSTDNVVIDDVKSEIAITVEPVEPARNKGIYNESEIKGFNIKVEDPAVANNSSSYAGIKSIEYKLTATSDTGEKIVMTGTDNEPYVPLEGFNGTNSGDHQKCYEGFVKLKPITGHSYVYVLEVRSEDWSGNTSRAESVPVIVDSISPEINNTYPEEDMLNGKYYNKDVELTTTIKERYLDIKKDVTYEINGANVTLEQLQARKEEYGVSSVTINHESDDTKRNDESVSTINVVFHADNEYVVSTSVLDKAGNSNSTTAYNFVVDQTAPEATLTYYSYGKGDTFAAGTGPDNIAYLGDKYSSFKVEVTVEELNFTTGGTVNADFTATARDSQGDVPGEGTENDLSSELTNYTANGKNATSWSNTGETTHKYSVDVKNDANYTFDFDYTDLAGNPLKVKVNTGYVTLDKVVPNGTVTINGLVNGTGENGGESQSWINSFIETITFGLFGKNNMSATLESDDATAGVAKTEYLYTSQFLTKDALAGRTDWTGYNGTVPLPANQNVIVYEKVTDKAGNVEYYSTQNLVSDNVDPAPQVTITPSSPAWGKGVYSASDNPGFDIVVTDPVVNEAYSGLKEITYKIVNGANGDTESGTLATFAKDAHQQSWSGHVSIDPVRFYSNDVQVTVYASDWSTNEATSEMVQLKVDNKAPIVRFDMSIGDVLNGKYYKNNKTLTITIDERNFDPSYTPTVTSTAGGGYSFSGWSTNGEITTGTITFSGDSDYTVTFDCYDLAGNKSNTERQEEFTVDKTLPVINVSYDNNSASNGNYYKASRTATVTITEHNFRASEVRVTTTAALDGKPITAPTAGGWSSYGDRHTAVISYPSDGDYTFDITYTDLAGNASADYAVDSFTVDLTNPEIEITGIKDKSANKGTVAPVVSFTDVNFASEDVALTLTGANKGKVPVDGMVSRANRNNGTTVTFKNFGKDMDDIYTLTAKTTDKAGNETSKSITFSVNRNGSTYEIDSATQEMLKSGFTNNPKDIIIKEINVDTLEFIEITYSKDGKVVKLKEGTDYTVKSEGGEGQWKKYTYTIKASCFEEEGEYSINIYSEDRANNTTTNKVKSKSIEFIVDKTPPTVSIANLENRGRYREDVHQFTLSVKDNTVLSYVELYIDGELVRTYSGDELTVVDGVITIDVDSSTSYQNIKLVAYDAAGNPTDPIEYEVLVTSSWWVQFFMNKPLFFGCIAAIVVVAAGAALLVVRTKKRKSH